MGNFLLVTDFQPPKMLKRVPLAGGQAMPIAEGGGVGATWGPNDTIVMGSHEGLWLVPASGGERTPLTTLSEGEQGHWLPRFLPSGRAVLFFIQTGDRDTGQVGVYDFDTGERRTLLSGTDSGLQPAGIWSSGATTRCGPCGLTLIPWKSAVPRSSLCMRLGRIGWAMPGSR